jgi:hypothetical protein
MTDLGTQTDSVDAKGALARAMDLSRNDPRLRTIAKLQEDDLQSFCLDAAQSISIWNAGEDLAASAHWFYRLGRFGEHHGIPVPEIVHLLALLNTAATEEEAETLLEVARYYVIRGYEDALR